MLRRLVRDMTKWNWIIKTSRVQLTFSSKQDNFKYSDEVMNKLKSDAKTFYEDAVVKPQAYVMELESMDQWQTEVRQSPIPVVIQCNATWSQPSEKLRTIMEEQAKLSGGKWKLIIVDIDRFPQLATALKIKSIPSVILVTKGNAVDGFAGVPGKEQLSKFLQTLQKIIEPMDQAQEMEQKFQELHDKWSEGDAKYLKKTVTELLKDPKYTRLQAQLYLYLAAAYLIEGSTQKCNENLLIVESKFADELKEDPFALEFFNMVRGNLDQYKILQKEDNALNKMLTQLDSTPQDLELSKMNYMKNLQSIAQMYKILIYQKLLKIDRNWQGGLAKKNLLEIFNELGSSNSLVIEGRKQMMRILY